MKSRQEFYSEVFGYAKDAGLSDTQAHLAASQASLETGFGKSVAGNNYFGVKAGSSWNGPTKDVRTWEEVGGKRQNITDRFRAYEHPVQSLRDWASTVGNRWSNAMSAPTFKEAVSALGAGRPGGYATDSKYGSKLNSIQSTYGRDVGIMAAIDPQSVPTPTARPDVAYNAPRPAVERAPLAKEVPMASFDMGRFGPTTTTAFDAGRFGPTPTTPAAFDMQRFGPVEAAAPGMEGLRQGLLAQQAAMGVAPYADPAVSRSVAAPSVQVQQPVDMTRTGATGMPAMAAPTISQAQRDIAAKTQKDMQTRSLLGTVGSAILGGALLGPVGGLLGGYVGKSLANANYFPDAPEKLNPSSSNDRGYGGLNDYGRSAYNESRDFRDAVDKGSVGLW